MRFCGLPSSSTRVAAPPLATRCDLAISALFVMLQVAVEQRACDGCKEAWVGTHAMRWEILCLLLFREECKVAASDPPSLMAPSRTVAAAALYVLMEGGCSLHWASQRSPLGACNPSCQRLRRLVDVMLGVQALWPWVHVPRTERCPLELLPVWQRGLVEAAARGWLAANTPRPSDLVAVQPPDAPTSSSNASPSNASQSTRLNAFLPPTHMSKSCMPPHPSASSSPMPRAPVDWPTAGAKIKMLQVKQLRADASGPPELIGIETSGPVFAAARRAACPVLRALLPTTRVATARVQLLWGDATARTRLDDFRDVVAGGVSWGVLERRRKMDLSWVHSRNATTPLYWYQGPEPLLIFQTGVGAGAPTSLTLELVACSNFLGLYPEGSPERLRIAKWETAGARGTPEAWLAVHLDDSMTLGEALDDDWSGGRHGPLHVKWMVHTDAQASQVGLQPDGRFQPIRSCAGEPGSPLAALYSLVDDFAPFAAKLYYAAVPAERLLEAHELGRINDAYPFSYVAINFMADGDVEVGDKCLRYQCNTGAVGTSNEPNIAQDNTNKGMDIHKDKNSGDTVVLTLGSFHGHPQLWPSCGLAIPLECWGGTTANSRHLLHGVGPGRGFRVTIVYTVHMSVAKGGRTVAGREVAWDLGVHDSRPMKWFEKARDA